MYSYDDIFLFVKVVEVGSFIATAKMLKIGQSTISRRMQRLEDELGLDLFRQSSRGFELTENGQALYQSFKGRNDGFDDLVAKLIGKQRNLEGTLKVALPTILAVEYIAAKIPEFLRKYPGINLEISLQTQEIDIVKYGFDLAILNHMPRQQSQKIKKIYSSESALYCTREYQAKYGIPETPDELCQHIVTGSINEDYSINGKIEFIHRTTGESIIVDMPKRIAINNVLISAPMLYTDEVIVGLLEIKNKAADDNIIRVLPDYCIRVINYYLVKHPYENNPLTGLFAEYIEGIFEKPHNY